jgi:hypothetical protein
MTVKMLLKSCAIPPASKPEKDTFQSSLKSWQNAEQCAQGSAVADSLAQAAARLRKVKRNRERGAVSATAPKLV